MDRQTSFPYGVCLGIALLLNAQIAQSVEQRTENPCVGGSNPPLGTISKAVANVFGFAKTLGFSPFSGPARWCLVLTRALSALTFAVSDNFGQTPLSRSHQVNAVRRLEQVDTSIND